MRVTIRHIQETVAEFYAVPAETFLLDGRGGNRERNTPKHVAMFFAREATNHSYKNIANYFQRSDHAIVVHAERKIQRLIAENDAFASDIAELRKVIGSNENFSGDNRPISAFVTQSASA